jgi:hypothetical protein
MTGALRHVTIRTAAQSRTTLRLSIVHLPRRAALRAANADSPKPCDDEMDFATDPDLSRENTKPGLHSRVVLSDKTTL